MAQEENIGSIASKRDLTSVEPKRLEITPRPRVIMCGPHLDAQTGISSVVKTWLASGFREHVDLTYIATLRNYVPGQRLRKFFQGLHSYFRLAMLENDDSVITHIHFSTGMSFWRKLVLFRIAKLKGHRTVIHMHAPEFKRFYAKSNLFKKSQIRGFFRDADILIVLSRDWQELCARICPEANIRILNNGVDIKRFSGRAVHGDRVNIVMMGRLGERKGTYDLFRAFSSLASENPNLHLILGGDGDVKELRSLAKAQSLMERVHILGWVSGANQIDVFRSADIYALPSYHEGFPGSILEAMAIGLPIVATPVGGVPELVRPGQNGFLVEPGNVLEIENALRNLASDPALRNKMGRESRRLAVEVYDARNKLKELLCIYSQLQRDRTGG